MATLGTAYVQIVPSAQGISGKIKSVLDPEAKSAGESAGKSISGSISKGLTTVGGTITSKVTKPVMAAGAALGGLTLAKGWSRMVEIDNARAKLTALGQDADAVKESARIAVDQTAYSLNTAMTTAASAVAAGVKPGEQLTKYLKDIADASAIAGVDMDEMGSIFNKVATNGKMSAEEMNQLSDRGIPVMTLLAKTTGKSMDEVRDAVSKGEIGIEELQAAIEEGMEGAAQSIGSSTISGAISNVNAALGRIGANIFGSSDDPASIAGKILPLLNAIMAALKPVEEKAASLGKTIAGAIGPAIDRVTNMLSGGTTAAERALALADRAKAKMAAIGIGVTSALGPIMLGVGKLIPMVVGLGGKLNSVAKILGTTRGSLLKFGGIFGLIVTAFITAYTQSESFRTAINQLGLLIGQTFLTVFQALGPLLQVAGQLFAQVATTLGDILGPVLIALMPVLQRVLGIVSRLVTTVIRIVAAIVRTITSMSKLPGKVRATFESIKNSISNKINAAKQRVSTVVNNIKSHLSFKGLAAKVGTTFTKIKDKVKEKIDKAKDAVRKAVNKIKNMFPFNVGKIFSGKISLPKVRVKKTKDGGASTSSSITTKRFAKAMDTPYMFSKETVFAAGDAGDEIMYGRRSLMNDITEALMAAIEPAGTTPASSGGTLNLIITLDGKTIGQASVDYVNDQTIMFGTNPILV